MSRRAAMHRGLALPAVLVLACLLGATAAPSLPVPAPAPPDAAAAPAPALVENTPQAPGVPPPAAAAPAPVDPRADSATEGEVARLNRLARADAERRAADTSVRDAPGRPDIAGGLRRCVDAAGGSIFTDRRCDAVGAGDAPPELAGPRVAPARPVSVRSCARSKGDLLDGVRNALEVHDVNRFADYYHWTGMDGATGYRLMDRLEAMTRRPFVDAQLVSSAAPLRPDADADADPGATAGLLSRGFDPPGAAGAPPLATPPRPRRADLLRVDQMRSDRDAGAQVTWFRLLSNAGCWWVTF